MLEKYARHLERHHVSAQHGNGSADLLPEMRASKINYKLGVHQVSLKEEIEQNPYQTCQGFAQRFGVCDETIRLYLYNLEKIWKLSKWETFACQGNKLQRLNICLSLLSRHKKDSFLDRILTCDEKWILYDNRKRKHHWSSTGSVSLTAKPNIHQQKVMLCVWWTSAGIIHYEFLESGKTITAEVYST